MKFRILTLCLLFTTFVWSQSTPQNQTSAPAPQSSPAQAQKGCPCCQKMADEKSTDHHDAMSCCHHKMAAKGDEAAMSCCKDGKCDMAEGKMCMKSKDGKTAQCEKGRCGDQAKGCCMKDKQGEGAMSCRGSGQCGEAHSHTTPGN